MPSAKRMEPIEVRVVLYVGPKMDIREVCRFMRCYNKDHPERICFYDPEKRELKIRPRRIELCPEIGSLKS